MWCSVRIAFFRGRTCSDYMFSFICICMTVYQYDNICDLFCYIISSALYLSFECHQNHLFCRRWCGCAWWNDWRRATGTRPGSWGERSRLEGSTVAIDNWACRGVTHKWCDFFVDSAGQAFIRTDCLKSGLTCRHVKTTPTANKKSTQSFGCHLVRSWTVTRRWLLATYRRVPSLNTMPLDPALPHSFYYLKPFCFKGKKCSGEKPILPFGRKLFWGKMWDTTCTCLWILWIVSMTKTGHELQENHATGCSEPKKKESCMLCLSDSFVWLLLSVR